MDKKAFFKVSYGLYIITSNCDSKDGGCIANTFVQVTSDPAKVCITLNKDNFTTSLIENSGVFNCGVLLEEVDMDIIRRFGFQSGKEVNKFADIEYTVDANKVKQITTGLAATFSCKVVNVIDVNTHVMFIGKVQDCQVISDKPVLTYATYHDKKKGTTPKNAPSYVEETTKSGYRCSVCGYILEADVLPDDYICPICKQPASVFEKL